MDAIYCRCTPIQSLCIQCIRRICHSSCYPCTTLALLMTHGRWMIWGIFIHIISGWAHYKVKIMPKSKKCCYIFPVHFTFIQAKNCTLIFVCAGIAVKLLVLLCLWHAWTCLLQSLFNQIRHTLQPAPCTMYMYVAKAGVCDIALRLISWSWSLQARATIDLRYILCMADSSYFTELKSPMWKKCKP